MSRLSGIWLGSRVRVRFAIGRLRSGCTGRRSRHGGCRGSPGMLRRIWWRSMWWGVGRSCLRRPLI